MAASKFATVLHRKTHKITFMLVYALLEWILIAFLLLNGLFSYFIAKFAFFFGLKPPCALCSRVDSLFEDGGTGSTSFRSLLCSAHASEVAELGDRLAEARKQKDIGEKELTCSCCHVDLERSFDDAIFEVKERLNQEEEEEEEERGYVLIRQEEEEDEEETLLVEFSDGCIVEDDSLEVMGFDQEILSHEERFMPVAVLDEITISGLGIASSWECESQKKDGCDEFDVRDLDIGVVLEEKRVLHSSVERSDVVEENAPVALSSDNDEAVNPRVNRIGLEGIIDISIEQSVAEEDSIIPQALEEDSKVVDMETNCEVSIGSEICEREPDEQNPFFEPTAPFEAVKVQEVASGHVATTNDEEDSKVIDMETNCEVSIGSEICEREPDEQIPFLELAAPFPTVEVQETASCHKCHVTTANDQEANATEQEVTTVESLDILPTEENAVEEDRATEIPTYSETTFDLLEKRLLSEKKEHGAASLDGSIISETEATVLTTVDQLKSALEAERKSLSALYSELEEERNAAAIAANQTMAMINRLQEEKAAMQMEALQYQRMTEEQSEYDQEALQLLNDLVMRREREKQELERELEVYKQKVLLYEDKERRRSISSYRKPNGVNGTSPVSSSAEDSDENIDDCCELDKSPSGLNSPTEQESAKNLIALDDSLTYFEVERLSILEDLKVLEEKLFSLEDGELGNTKTAENFSDDDDDALADVLHLPRDGYLEDLSSSTGKLHHEGRGSSCKGKRLLPLFDAVTTENGEEQCMDAEAEKGNNLILAKEQERLAIVEEVDHVYERLQALEADKEFLRHCIKSLNKGNKGMELLQEILQHLRELRNVELQARTSSDTLAPPSA